MADDPHEAAALAQRLRRHVADPRVLAAIVAVPRGPFVPGAGPAAYADRALPLAEGQTISQPLVVARMLDLLAVGPADRVLDVGTGSGWHAALLAHLGAHVWSVERIAELARTAAATLRAAGVGNVTVVEGDGAGGLADHAPYDRVNVAAATPERALAALEAQLARGGRLVAPVVDERGGQRLVLVRRGLCGGLSREAFEAVRFVPLVAGNGGSGGSGAA